ncbi:MAG: DUF1016 N-terminal domain-containing protein [Candidatus Altiarchaeia archaeon]
MKKTKQTVPAEGFDVIYQNIRDILENARYTTYRAINSSMVSAYWQIGRVIVEEEQKGKKRANYRETLIEELSKRLTRDYGKNFSRRNPVVYKRLLSELPDSERTAFRIKLDTLPHSSKRGEKEGKSLLWVGMQDICGELR